MIHYTGWYYCTQSHWDGKIFDARNLVSIDGVDHKQLLNRKSLYPDDEYNSWKSYFELKPEVIAWLEANVKDEKPGLPGWCCGNKEYTSQNSELEFSLFFYRRKDALHFIRTWSIHKKPTETYNQNTYVRKILDPKTNRLKLYQRESES